VRLKRPRLDLHRRAGELFAAPVPPGTPSRDQTLEPIPSTGPYKISEVRWPKAFTLVRNRYFEPTETVPATNPDRIIVDVVDGGKVALEQLAAGDADYAAVPIAPASLEQAKRKSRLQLRAYTRCQHPVLLHEHDTAAFQRRPRPPSRELRTRTGGSWLRFSGARPWPARTYFRRPTRHIHGMTFTRTTSAKARGAGATGEGRGNAHNRLCSNATRAGARAAAL